MIIAAISDIHSPRNFEPFVKSVDSMKMKPDMFLIAGDMIERGSWKNTIKSTMFFLEK